MRVHILETAFLRFINDGEDDKYHELKNNIIIDMGESLFYAVDTFLEKAPVKQNRVKNGYCVVYSM